MISRGLGWRRAGPLTSTTLVGMGLLQGVAPFRARVRMVEPEMEMKSSCGGHSKQRSMRHSFKP
jgi:hypothetical protein